VPLKFDNSKARLVRKFLPDTKPSEVKIMLGGQQNAGHAFAGKEAPGEQS
jgi:hypothetical protein